MKYFIDTEFIFNPAIGMTFLTPISLALVAEDGRELYLYDDKPSVDWRDGTGPFVQSHVMPVIGVLPGIQCLDTEWRELIIEFIGPDIPDFWGDYSAFDYVVLSHAMGGFDHWPRTWPMHINDFQQLGIEAKPSVIPHNALADARALAATDTGPEEEA